MRANTKTLLSLYDFARILEINPLHFAGIDLPGMTLQHPHCTAQAWIQYAWQFADRTSRESVAQVIATAESRIADLLGFDVLPTWHAGEEVQTTQPYNPDLFNRTGRGERGFAATVRTRRGYVISGGCRKLTACDLIPQEIEVGDLSPPDTEMVNVFWEDDSYWVKGEVWAAVPAGTAPCDVHIYYPDKNGDPAWEIRPATVEIVNTTAVITIRRECAVKQSVWDSLAPRAAIGTDDNDFLDDFDVFIETIDPSCMMTMDWRPLPSCSCSGTGCQECLIPDQQGAFVPINSKLGFVQFFPATWDATTSSFNRAHLENRRQPDSLQVAYLAGYEDGTLACPRRQMSEELAQAVTFYASSMLQRPLCACNTDTWRHWRTDLSENAPKGSYWAINYTPFGNTRGAIFAWEKVRALSLGLSPDVH